VPGSLNWSLTPGPDGQLWTFLGNQLVRIRPETGELVPVGTIRSAGQIVFVGQDIYLTGAVSLRRIRHAVRIER
jgi:hypothetical protein